MLKTNEYYFFTLGTGNKVNSLVRLDLNKLIANVTHRKINRVRDAYRVPETQNIGSLYKHKGVSYAGLIRWELSNTLSKSQLQRYIDLLSDEELATFLAQSKFSIP